MSKKASERAARAEKDRAKKARKAQDKIDKTEQDRAKSARKAQDKIDKTEQDRTESARKDERSRVFDEYLSGTGKSKGCCEPCNYNVRTENGEYQPCKMGHKDSGPDKEVCADCSFAHYRPKK